MNSENRSKEFSENERGSRQYMYVSKCVKGSVKFAAKSREKSKKRMLKERKMLRNEGHDLEIKSCCSARLARLRDWNRSHFDPILRTVTEILGKFAARVSGRVRVENEAQ